MDEQARKSTLAGVLCYVFWGIAPIYWTFMDEVNSFEIIGHRIIWCFVMMVIVCAVLKIDFVSLLKDKRAVAYLLPAAILITVNWSVYIYAVSVDRIVETAIGYYINPLVSIVFGIFLFNEKLSKYRIAAICLCAFGVLFFTINYGQFPVFSIVLALSFGAYGAVKKKAGYPATQALAIESTFMLIPSIAICVVTAMITGQHAFASGLDTANGWIMTLLLIGAGPVTAIPLLLFAKAANGIPLSMLGFIQYISPTIALMVGVFFNGEPFTLAHAVCLGSIWCGLALVSFEVVTQSRKAR